MWVPRGTRPSGGARGEGKPRVSDPLTVPTREGLSLSCSAMKRIVQEAEEAFAALQAPQLKKKTEDVVGFWGEEKKETLGDSGRLEQKEPLGTWVCVF